MAEKKKTPYQGKKKVFGVFKCEGEDCANEWKSAHTWANKGQECKQDGTMVYPHEQRPLKKSGKQPENKKPHLQDLCQKCRELGQHCGL